MNTVETNRRFCLYIYSQTTYTRTTLRAGLRIYRTWKSA